jgi:NADP-dependent 3-hydroxy acid dehydrogenase YdfG
MRAEDVANAILYALAQPANVNVREIWLAPTSAVR